MLLSKGSLRILRLFGIDVHIHWTWLLAGLFLWGINGNDGLQGGWIPRILLYLTLFGIVLLHEFGHALACKSVGGTADRIVLWPLGGVAFVQPPPRPGAVLWSIAAGPLVNVALVPATVMLLGTSYVLWGGESPVAIFFLMVLLMNLALLVFNLLPIYPLDGGQIVHALLWYVAGRGRSLWIVAWLGVAGGVGFTMLGFMGAGFWIVLIGMFMLFQSIAGVQQGRLLMALENAERRARPACPECGEEAPAGAERLCACGQGYDAFAHGGACPHCGRYDPILVCPRCNRSHVLGRWYGKAEVPDAAARPGPAMEGGG